MNHYREFPPPVTLAECVECFWTHKASPRGQRVLPDACIDLVFSRATGLRLVGTMTRPLLLPASQEEFLGVRFRPGMARLFIGASTVETADQLLPLKDIWGKRARSLEEQLRNASAPEQMLTFLQAELTPPARISPVQRAIEHLARNAGSIPLREISRRAGIGERQLRRRCLEETGITPKQLARISRFRRASSSIHPDTHFASLALECGYYDQSHLIRDFQEFSGQTPGDRFFQYHPLP